jgi:tetratricopeptide (TPR) repeat protein
LDALRVHRAGGEHRAVIRLARTFLEQPEGLTDAEGFEVARAGAGAAMALQEFHVAARFAEQERLWALATGDPDSQALAAYHHGTALLYLGDAPAAVAHLQEFMAAGDRPALARYRGAALFNLGACLLQQRTYPEAVRQFLASHDACQAQGDHVGTARALLEAAWAELLEGKIEPAGYRLEQAAAILAQHPDDHLTAVRLVHQAYCHYRSSEYGPAARLCEEVLAPGRTGVTAHQLSEAAWIAGECALVQGNLTAARHLAALALDEAIRANWPGLMNRANDLRMRVQAADKKQGLR